MGQRKASKTDELHRRHTSQQRSLAGFAGRCRDVVATCQLSASDAERRRHAQRRQFVAPVERVPLHDARDQMERRRQCRAHQTGPAPRAVDHRDGKLRLHAHVIQHVGIGGALGAIGGMVMAKYAGWVLDSIGTYTPIFIVAGSAYLFALLIVHVLSPRLAPVKIT